MRLRLVLSLCFLSSIAVGAPHASAVGPDRTLDWMAANRSATPEFSPGDVITFEEADKVRPFVPPAYQDIMIFDGMQVEIGETSDLSPSDAYKQATLQHQGQVVLAEDGALENYVAGQPFDDSKFKPRRAHPSRTATATARSGTSTSAGRPRASTLQRFYGTWVREGGEHDTTGQIEDGYEDMFQGGGTFPRILWGNYYRARTSTSARTSPTRTTG